MKFKTMSVILSAAAGLSLCSGNLLAQDDNGGGPGGPGVRIVGGPGGNFDPAQFQQRMMEQMRNTLSVTNDDEWSVIQPLIQKVMDARRDVGNGGGMGMGMVMRMGGPGGPPPGGDRGGPGGRGGFGPQASDEQKALQKALGDKAPVAQIKDALAKYRAAQQDKQAKLEAAQAHLKSVLTVQQEAQAVLMGLLP